MGLAISGKDAAIPDFYIKKKKLEEKLGGVVLSNSEAADMISAENANKSTLADSGTSVFDPVLCELAYAWYTNEGDTVIDPFAGGSVRGIVAEKMGRFYTGVELRAEQVAANTAQGSELCDACPKWVQGDSAHIDELLPETGFDFMFTCPPYADLEVYSDDPADISNMSIDGFLEMYEIILRKTVEKLAEDRFAVIVIGDARGKDGFYYNLPGKTVEFMERAGARYYNEAILVTPVGSLPIRVGRQFSASRKLGKTHQNVLTFVKGDWKKASKRLGEVTIPEILDR